MKKHGLPILVGLMVCLAPFSGVAGQSFEVSQFIAPGTCSDCHSDIYAQWQHSMHGLAHPDPIYQKVAKFFLTGLTHPGEVAESESCVKCHTPVGVVTGFPQKTSDDWSKIPEIATRGVQCDFCHSAVGAEKMYNNGMILSPGNGEEDPGVKRGPIKDPVPEFHKAEFSEFHTGAEICGTCHNVKHVAFGTALETTYDEWKDGPYNAKDPAKRVVCQECHMRQKPGVPSTGSTPRPDNPGQASDIGPERDHVYTHYFVGANSFVPAQFGDSDNAAMAAERLAHSATLALDTGGLKKKVLKVTVTNTGAGHKLPTGLTNAREMWLEVTVKSKQDGRVLYASGVPDADGYLADSAVVYHTVFGDDRGKPVDNISLARKILKDRRIPPRESVTETFKLPSGTPATDVVVSARLQYRICSQHLLDLVMGKGVLKVPVVTMAQADAEL